MDHIRTGFQHSVHLLTQARKVRCQDRGGDFEVPCKRLHMSLAAVVLKSTEIQKAFIRRQSRRRCKVCKVLPESPDVIYRAIRWPSLYPIPRDGATQDHETLSDRKSTRLNSSHVAISYAVFCLK